ncbi:MAG: adenosylcobinamide-GDP ribazoletransferase, partial [Firmicutes bacterium]|nr:adenosylcobinamide-GDP ribazoletransferase [Bacillota bacterium]
MKAPHWLRDIALLLTRLTYLPLPKKWRSEPSRLPRAMRFLPLLGAVSGGIVYGCMRLFVVMPLTGAAAVLIGVELLCGGAFLLRDLMRTADGKGGSIGDAAQDMLNDEPILDNDTEISVKQRRFDVGRAGLVWGLVRTLALYLIYL